MRPHGHSLVTDQLIAILMDRIDSGYYKKADDFPSEAQLCKEFGVSRSTVRTALAALVANGLVVKRPGLGTFLTAKSRLEGGLEQLESVLSLAKKQSLSSQVADLSVKTIDSNAFFAEKLSAPIDTLLTSVGRTIIVDEIPTSFHIDYVPQNWLKPEQVNGAFAGSVLDLLRELYSQHLYEAVTEITAVSAKKEVASLLKVPHNKALVLLKEVLYEETGTAISYSENYFVPEHICFRLVRREGIKLSQ
jgi:GntR family transcriptional regulator